MSHSQREAPCCGITPTLEPDRIDDRASALFNNARRDDFVAVLAHELRNPISALCTALHVLDHNPADRATVDRIRAIFSRQLRTLSHLLDDLLEASRLTHDKLVLQRTPVDLTKILPQVLKSTEELMRDRCHELVVRFEAGALTTLGDVTRLEQVFANVLHNAAKFTAPGGRIEVALTAARRGGTDWAKISIADNGCGIAPSLLRKVFDLFVQGEQPLDRHAGGLGVGLNIARRLVELHDGSIEAHSSGPGCGSTFTVWLPLTPSEGHCQAARAGRTAAERVQPCTVVIVEDNADARETLEELLDCAGHAVRSAQDGFNGVRLITQVKPDIAFVDVGLPGLSGYEVARQIRREPTLKATHLVALTGYSGPQARNEALAAGFSEHLTKPFRLEQLFRLMANLPGRRS